LLLLLLILLPESPKSFFKEAGVRARERVWEQRKDRYGVATACGLLICCAKRHSRVATDFDLQIFFVRMKMFARPAGGGRGFS
jgi:hypothetical protein